MPSKSRDEKTRTSGLPLPKRTLYLAELRPGARLPPSELCGGSLSMTVRAADLTLREFGAESFPAHAIANHDADVAFFFPSNMIEVENAEIALAALDATTSLKVFDHPFPVSLYISTPVDGAPRHVSLSVPTIVGLSILTSAGAAVAITVRATCGHRVAR
jgi:hypothetical protein